MNLDLVEIPPHLAAAELAASFSRRTVKYSAAVSASNRNALSGWKPPCDTEIFERSQMDLVDLQARGFDLHLNNPDIRGHNFGRTARCVGDGVTFQCLPVPEEIGLSPDATRETARQINRVRQLHSEAGGFDAGGRMRSEGVLQYVAFLTQFPFGSCLIHRVWNTDKTRLLPLSIELIPGSRISQPYWAAGDPLIHNGVVYADDYRSRVTGWYVRRVPKTIGNSSVAMPEWDFISVTDGVLLELLEPAGVDRSFPNAVACMRLVFNRGEMTELAVEAARAHATTHGILKVSEGHDPALRAEDLAPDGFRFVDGVKERLIYKGDEYTLQAATLPGPDFPGFIKTTDSRLVRALNTRGSEFTRTMDASYSGGMQERQIDKPNVDVLRQNFVDTWRVIHGWYLDAVALSGRIALPNYTAQTKVYWLNARVRFPGEAPLNPVDHETAKNMRIANGTSSEIGECEAEGHDYAQIQRERAEAYKIRRDAEQDAQIPDGTLDPTNDLPAVKDTNTTTEQAGPGGLPGKPEPMKANLEAARRSMAAVARRRGPAQRIAMYHAAFAGGFEESKHPRADDGKFGSGGGSESSEKSGEKTISEGKPLDKAGRFDDAKRKERFAEIEGISKQLNKEQDGIMRSDLSKEKKAEALKKNNEAYNQIGLEFKSLQRIDAMPERERKGIKNAIAAGIGEKPLVANDKYVDTFRAARQEHLDALPTWTEDDEQEAFELEAIDEMPKEKRERIANEEPEETQARIRAVREKKRAKAEKVHTKTKASVDASKSKMKELRKALSDHMKAHKKLNREHVKARMVLKKHTKRAAGKIEYGARGPVQRYFAGRISEAARVDFDKRMIAGVAIATIGPALGHDSVEVDAETLTQIAALGAKIPTRSRMDHPESEASQDTIEISGKLKDVVGAFENFRVDGDKVLADFYAVSESAPGGKEATGLLHLANDKRIARTFGVSMICAQSIKNKKIRVANLFSIDWVDVPALNPTGVFSGDSNMAEEGKKPPFTVSKGGDGKYSIKCEGDMKTGESYSFDMPADDAKPAEKKPVELAANAADTDDDEAKKKDEKPVANAAHGAKIYTAADIEAARLEGQKESANKVTKYNADFDSIMDAAAFAGSDREEFRKELAGKDLEVVRFCANERVKTRTKAVGSGAGGKANPVETDAITRYNASAGVRTLYDCNTDDKDSPEWKTGLAAYVKAQTNR